jgi:hypothetical protein
MGETLVAATTSQRYSDATARAAWTPEGQETQTGFPRFAAARDAQPERKWQIEVQQRLFKLTQLPQGWDGYSASPIRRDTGFFALEVLNKIVRGRTPIPQVVPSSVGGIQLEWHEKNIDLELHIVEPYKAELWFQDHSRPQEEPVSVDLTSDFTALLDPIQRLTSR